MLLKKLPIYAFILFAVLNTSIQTANYDKEIGIWVAQMEVTVEEPKSISERLEYLVSRGEIRSKIMEITTYSVTLEDCGKLDGITASGELIHEGVVAADPSIPFGTRLYIEGIGFVVVKDRGGAIKGDILDLYIPDPEEAKKFGRQKRKVYFLGG